MVHVFNPPEEIMSLRGDVTSTLPYVFLKWRQCLTINLWHEVDKYLIRTNISPSQKNNTAYNHPQNAFKHHNSTVLQKPIACNANCCKLNQYRNQTQCKGLILHFSSWGKQYQSPKGYSYTFSEMLNTQLGTSTWHNCFYSFFYIYKWSIAMTDFFMLQH